jgi:NitT/TauT family transport system substrate-binding protein
MLFRKPDSNFGNHALFLRHAEKAESMPSMKKRNCVIATALVLVASLSGAAAQEVLKVAVPGKGGWESAAPELGQQAGIFKKHGITLDLQYVAGTTEAEAAVVSGSADIALGVDAMAALRAYSRGTPVRVIGANLTGDAHYWYVLPNSPIRTVKDMVGRSVAYASNGSSSQYDLIDLLKRFGVKARIVASGGAAATLEQMQQNRLDVGWARPPFGLEEIEQGKIRVVARSNDVPRIRSKTETVLVTRAATLERRADAIAQFMKAYRESVEWMYADSDAPKRYAEYAGISPAAARRLRDEFFPKGMLLPDQVIGLRAIIRDAIAQRYIQFRPSRKQVTDLIRTPTPMRDSAADGIVSP